MNLSLNEQQIHPLSHFRRLANTLGIFRLTVHDLRDDLENRLRKFIAAQRITRLPAADVFAGVAVFSVAPWAPNKRAARGELLFDGEMIGGQGRHAVSS